jgi:double-strand break repair protein MRE11
LTILTEKGLGDAIQEFIEKDEKDAISELINFQINKLQVNLLLLYFLFY